MGPIVGITEFRGMLARRGPVMAAVLVVTLLVALLQAMTLPRTYEATAVLQVQPTLLTGGMDSDATANRLRTIEQRIMARSNVLDMADRYNMFDDLPLTDDERVGLFRQNVNINFVSAVSGGGGGAAGAQEVSIIQIVARTDHAADAAALTNDIAQQVLTGNLQVRDRRLNELISTLETEDRRTLETIARIEAELAAFRAENVDRMPENLPFLASEQARLEAQRTELTRSLQSLERERLALEVGGTEDGAQTPVAQQLRVLEVNLAQAQRTLAPDHPEVLRLEEQIASLRRGTGQQLTVGQTRQIDLISQQEEALTRERDQIESRLPVIAENIAGIPQVSEQLADYARQLAGLEVPRSAIAERLSQARLDQSLITSNYGEQMTLLESASEPEYPLSSGRKKIAAMGVIAGLGLALIAGFLLELRRPILRTEAMVQKYLGVSPVAALPYHPTTSEQLIHRMRGAASLGILILGAVGAAIIVTTGSG